MNQNPPHTWEHHYPYYHASAHLRKCWQYTRDRTWTGYYSCADGTPVDDNNNCILPSREAAFWRPLQSGDDLGGDEYDVYLCRHFAERNRLPFNDWPQPHLAEEGIYAGPNCQETWAGGAYENHECMIHGANGDAPENHYIARKACCRRFYG